ncbi:hypothetical protein HPB49_001892 [Dermacentor silvarum]|uniref:Uncharacterized protein n=1 Tax=Dermacentor silvarum TaxID=543639 RepID=A0ACB8CP17_DERSI|nr:hypothetical protein HPB49_001892 [Dermacentor silvarum]
MKTRKERLNISDVHFDPSVVDIVMSEDKLVIVPAGAALALYQDGDLTALNVGSLGQIVGTRFLQRFRQHTAKPKPECLAPADSKAEDVFGTLLAHQCTQKVFRGSVHPNSSTVLPMHLRLTPAKQLFIAACSKSSSTSASSAFHSEPGSKAPKTADEAASAAASEAETCGDDAGNVQYCDLWDTNPATVALRLLRAEEQRNKSPTAAHATPAGKGAPSP